METVRSLLSFGVHLERSYIDIHIFLSKIAVRLKLYLLSSVKKIYFNSTSGVRFLVWNCSFRAIELQKSKHASSGDYRYICLNKTIEIGLFIQTYKLAKTRISLKIFFYKFPFQKVILSITRNYSAIPESLTYFPENT